MEKNEHKATIETMINTIAIAFTAAGTTMALGKEWWGLLLICCGIVLEFLKYYGRHKKLW